MLHRLNSTCIGSGMKFNCDSLGDRVRLNTGDLEINLKATKQRHKVHVLFDSIPNRCVGFEFVPNDVGRT